MSVPREPEQFFTEYVPRRFSGVAGEFAGKSSAGSLVFRVVGAGVFSFRLRDGALLVEHGMTGDAIAQISVSRGDFEPLVVKAAERLHETEGALDKQLVAFRALGLDAERAAMIRGISGSVGLSIVDGAVVSRIVITPGGAEPSFDRPECDVSIDLADFLALQQGQNPIELLMNGKIRITGNAQIALALSGLLA